MTARDLSVVAIRVLSVYPVIQAISFIPDAFSEIQNHNLNTAGDLVFVLSPILLNFLIGVSLWGLAPYLSSHAAKPTQGEHTDAQVSARDLHAIAISTLGLFIVVMHLPELPIIFWQYAHAEEISSFSGSTRTILRDGFLASAAKTTLHLALGLLLMTGANYWAAVLRRFRDFGNK